MNLAAGKVVILTTRTDLIKDTKVVSIDSINYSICIAENHIDSWKLMLSFPASKLSESYKGGFSIDGINYTIRIAEDHIDSWKLMLRFPASKLSESYDSDDKSRDSVDLRRSQTSGG